MEKNKEKIDRKTTVIIMLFSYVNLYGASLSIVNERLHLGRVGSEFVAYGKGAILAGAILVAASLVAYFYIIKWASLFIKNIYGKEKWISVKRIMNCIYILIFLIAFVKKNIENEYLLLVLAIVNVLLIPVGLCYLCYYFFIAVPESEKEQSGIFKYLYEWKHRKKT